MAQRTAEAHLARAERLQNATGALATAAMAAMEANLPWFGKLSAQDRSWIGLVAQSGITPTAAHPCGLVVGTFQSLSLAELVKKVR